MPNEHPDIVPRLQEWIAHQPMFFVATAPTVGGRVNVSPKGYDSFAILDEQTVAYLDLTGSGAETIAHLRDNGRITIMFCSFTGPPNIVRLQGTGEVVFPDGSRFPSLASRSRRSGSTQHHRRACRACGGLVRIRCTPDGARRTTRPAPPLGGPQVT